MLYDSSPGDAPVQVLENIVRQDPNAFYIIQEGVHLSDNFIRRLSE